MRKSSLDFNADHTDPRMADLLAEYPTDLFGDGLYRSIAWANRYVACLVETVLSELEIVSPPVDAAEAVTLCQTRGLAERFVPSLIWLGRFRQSAANDTVALPPDVLRAAGLAINAGNARTAALLDAAARALPRFARGEATGEDLLLGAESVSLWLDYFDNANPLYAANNRVAALAAERQLAGRNHLNVLELGAGAGSATQSLLKELAEASGEQRIGYYVVSEPSAFFRRRSERRLTGCSPALIFRSLDIDRPWSEQGLAGAQFDLVFAVNVLHVARDLNFSLEQIRGSLAPGGWLIAGECIRPFPGYPVYIELAFRLLETFNRRHELPEMSAETGFLTPEGWTVALERAGFTDVCITPDHTKIREIFPHLFVGAVCALGFPQGE